MFGQRYKADDLTLEDLIANSQLLGLSPVLNFQAYTISDFDVDMLGSLEFLMGIPKGTLTKWGGRFLLNGKVL